jgi:hypothetical protein
VTVGTKITLVRDGRAVRGTICARATILGFFAWRRRGETGPRLARIDRKDVTWIYGWPRLDSERVRALCASAALHGEDAPWERLPDLTPPFGIRFAATIDIMKGEPK